MANDTESQQIEEWKQKYYLSLTTLEQQQSYDELLQRSLGRLALAAQGLDPALDRQLKSLRDVLRGKKDQQGIQKILNQMEKAITKMESNSNKNTSQTTGEVIAELLTSLKLVKPFKYEAKTLARQLKPATNKNIIALIPEVLSLFERIIKPKPVEKSKAFGFNLFGKSKMPEQEPLDLLTSEKQPLEDNIDNSSTNSLSNNQVLMSLLERLSLPTDLSKKATKIRHQLDAGIDDAQLAITISEIAEIISTLGSQVINEKQDYQEFLKSLTTRLNELDQHIRKKSTEDVKAFEQCKEMGNAVKEQVISIRDEVKGADDLDVLKLSVSKRLDSLNQHFESYRESDQTRFKQSQKQIQELNSRLQAMEKESVELRVSAGKSRNLALKDALTGIWNRQALNENVGQEFVRWQRYQKPLSMVIWDIDFFKRVNDEYGHAAGDKVLKTIARILCKQRGMLILLHVLAVKSLLGYSLRHA